MCSVGFWKRSSCMMWWWREGADLITASQTACHWCYHWFLNRRAFFPNVFICLQWNNDVLQTRFDYVHGFPVVWIQMFLWLVYFSHISTNYEFECFGNSILNGNTGFKKFLLFFLRQDRGIRRPGYCGWRKSINHSSSMSATTRKDIFAACQI